jgi:FxLD family lantipeptide
MIAGRSTDLGQRTDEWAEADPFDLDIRIIESGDAAVLINLTDDGCGSTCPKACATNVG